VPVFHVFSIKMEVKILESSKDSIKIELIGEDHTFANALRKELWNNSGVKLAGYNVEHPLVSNPVLVVDSDGKQDPKKILLKAVEDLRKKNLIIIEKLKKF
jgi:DNA-directed RNA polymerase subunit L